MSVVIYAQEAVCPCCGRTIPIEADPARPGDWLLCELCALPLVWDVTGRLRPASGVEIKGLMSVMSDADLDAWLALLSRAMERRGLTLTFPRPETRCTPPR